jgi:hypothetical protein
VPESSMRLTVWTSSLPLAKVLTNYEQLSCAQSGEQYSTIHLRAKPVDSLRVVQCCIENPCMLCSQYCH